MQTEQLKGYMTFSSGIQLDTVPTHKLTRDIQSITRWWTQRRQVSRQQCPRSPYVSPRIHHRGPTPHAKDAVDLNSRIQISLPMSVYTSQLPYRPPPFRCSSTLQDVPTLLNWDISHLQQNHNPPFSTCARHWLSQFSLTRLRTAQRVSQTTVWPRSYRM